MHDELFKRPTIVARYRAGPYAESRERFLKQAYADGYSLPTANRGTSSSKRRIELRSRSGATIFGRPSELLRLRQACRSSMQNF